MEISIGENISGEGRGISTPRKVYKEYYKYVLPYSSLFGSDPKYDRDIHKVLFEKNSRSPISQGQYRKAISKIIGKDVIAKQSALARITALLSLCQHLHWHNIILHCADIFPVQVYEAGLGIYDSPAHKNYDGIIVFTKDLPKSLYLPHDWGCCCSWQPRSEYSMRPEKLCEEERNWRYLPKDEIEEFTKQTVNPLFLSYYNKANNKH